nr:hypothetical protein CFP56_67358 [Quercus suber]
MPMVRSRTARSRCPYISWRCDLIGRVSSVCDAQGSHASGLLITLLQGWLLECIAASVKHLYGDCSAIWSPTVSSVFHVQRDAQVIEDAAVSKASRLIRRVRDENGLPSASIRANNRRILEHLKLWGRTAEHGEVVIVITALGIVVSNLRSR